MIKIFEAKPKYHELTSPLPFPNLNEGDRFGRLVVLQCDSEDRAMVEDGFGEKWDSQPFVVMECECGNWLKVWRTNFPGKRKMKDCGCGISQDDGSHTMITVTAPIQVRRLIQQYKQKYGVSFSRAAVELVRKGAAVEGMK